MVLKFDRVYQYTTNERQCTHLNHSSTLQKLKQDNKDKLNLIKEKSKFQTHKINEDLKKIEKLN